MAGLLESYRRSERLSVRRGTRECALARTRQLLRTAPPRGFNPPLHNSVAVAGRSVLFPRFVLHDEKLPTTVLTGRRGKEDRASGPKV